MNQPRIETADSGRKPSSRDGRRRITVDLGSVELYRALKFASVERGVAAREIVAEALREWLHRHQRLSVPTREEAANGH